MTDPPFPLKTCTDITYMRYISNRGETKHRVDKKSPISTTPNSIDVTFTSEGFDHYFISVRFELILMYLLAKQSFSSVNVSFQSAVITFNDFNKPECVFIMSVVIFIQIKHKSQSYFGYFILQLMYTTYTEAL